MQRLNIKAFNNGVVQWSALGADAYLLEVDGSSVSDGDDGFFRAESFDFSVCPRKPIDIKITAVRDGELGSSLCITTDAQRKSLYMSKVKPVVSDGVLHWAEVSGALCYKLTDIKRNVITVTDTSYDMNYGNLILSVIAVSSMKLVADGESATVGYLRGKGTEREPYIISTPFDLRAIDCYESAYFDAKRENNSVERNHYKIANDIDFDSVAALEGESNLFTLSQPFFGVLDGCDKRLTNVSVGYDGGYWALFDFVARGATVKNIIFSGIEITNVLQSAERPLDASIATVANVNYGMIKGIAVYDMKYTSAGGAVCGICAHNSGCIAACTVSGELAQGTTGLDGQACYEMAGIVIENRDGGVLEDNAVLQLHIRGTATTGGGTHYHTVFAAGGIAAVNREGGRLSGNMYSRIVLTNAESAGEFGGLCAYNAGVVVVGNADNIGSVKLNGEEPMCRIGKGARRFGAIVGDNDGTVFDPDVAGEVRDV